METGLPVVFGFLVGHLLPNRVVGQRFRLLYDVLFLCVAIAFQLRDVWEGFEVLRLMRPVPH